MGGGSCVGGARADGMVLVVVLLCSQLRGARLTESKVGVWGGAAPMRMSCVVRACGLRWLEAMRGPWCEWACCHRAGTNGGGERFCAAPLTDQLLSPLPAACYLPARTSACCSQCLPRCPWRCTGCTNGGPPPAPLHCSCLPSACWQRLRPCATTTCACRWAACWILVS